MQYKFAYLVNGFMGALTEENYQSVFTNFYFYFCLRCFVLVMQTPDQRDQRRLRQKVNLKRLSAVIHF